MKTQAVFAMEKIEGFDFLTASKGEWFLFKINYLVWHFFDRTLVSALKKRRENQEKMGVLWKKS